MKIVGLNIRKETICKRLSSRDYENDYPSKYREENSDAYREMMFQKRKASIIVDKFKDLLKSVWGFLKDFTKNIVSVLRDWVKNIWNYISGTDKP